MSRVPEPRPFHEPRHERLPCAQPGCSWGAPGPVTVGDSLDYLWVEVG